MPSVALITEGEFDIYAYSTLIRRENEHELGIHARLCRGSVSGRFVRILNEFRYANPSISKAIVVSDAHGKARIAWRTELQAQARNAAFPFPVEYVIVVEELEAILLCDPTAVESVCAERGSAIALPNLVQSPELIPEPKEELVRQLVRGNLTYTRAIAEQIAARADLARLAYWSQSYRDFQTAVRL